MLLYKIFPLFKTISTVSMLGIIVCPSLILCFIEKTRAHQLLLFAFLHLICLSLDILLDQKEEDVQKLASFPLNNFIISVPGVSHLSTENVPLRPRLCARKAKA